MSGVEEITLLSIVGVYISGVATSFTPCIYPLLPIVIGYLGNQNGSKLQRFLAALFYVLGVAIIYTTLGMVAALTGTFFGELASNSYVYLGVGLFLLIMGGGMMDWYRIPLPQFFQNSPNVKGGWLRPLFVGMSSGLVASPCSAPVLGSILVVVASGKSVVGGGILMFVFSLGLTSVLLALGLSANFMSKLPKSGAWMVWVKRLLGLVIIGSGLFFVFKAGRAW